MNLKFKNFQFKLYFRKFYLYSHNSAYSLSKIYVASVKMANSLSNMKQESEEDVHMASPEHGKALFQPH